jgi:4-carboxymuconolactone decarboxylase
MRRRTAALVLAWVLAVAVPGGAQTAANGALPADIFPESGNRLPLVRPGARGVDAIRLHASGVDVRWQSPLGRQLTELAILTTAREHDQPYEWSLHEIEALAVGLEPAVIDLVRHRRPLAGLDEKQTVIIELGRELFSTHALTSATYARALKALGQPDLVDILILMANYAATGTRLTAVNQQMPAGWKQLLPLPFTPPDDIHPDSRSRLPYAKAAIPDVVIGPLYSRSLAPEGTGPTHIRRHGSGMKLLEAGVGKPLVALAALVTAHEHHNHYHWTMTERAAARDGLSADAIDVVRHGKPARGLPPREAALIEFGRELFGKHTISASTYATALDAFGKRNLVDLVDLMARHVADATLLAAFDQRLR